MGPQCLPMGVFGPLPERIIGLLLGRSGWTLKGLQVHPGLIDANYTGEIQIMASSPRGVMAIPQGERIAQLLLLPFCSDTPAIGGTRGDKGFGSSDAYWIHQITSKKPEMHITLNGKPFKGLLDTGADVSVIAEQHWPATWPTRVTATQLQGLGIANAPRQSSQMLTWRDEEGHEGEIQPYVVPHLPINLWGRDILATMGALICSPNEVVTKQMLAQGYRSSQGLGKTGSPQTPLEARP